MQMKNITIAGRIGKSAETRQTQQGDQVTGFSVAVDEGFGDKKRTIWFDVSFWGKRGASVAQYLTKGAQVTVTGDLSTREHEGKTYLTVRANDLTLQGGKRDDSQSSDTGQSHGGGYGAPATGGAGGVNGDIEDSIPFKCW
jgi:single-strand DNA-binding protein